MLCNNVVVLTGENFDKTLGKKTSNTVFIHYLCRLALCWRTSYQSQRLGRHVTTDTGLITDFLLLLFVSAAENKVVFVNFYADWWVDFLKIQLPRALRRKSLFSQIGSCSCCASRLAGDCSACVDKACGGDLGSILEYASPCLYPNF